MQTTTTKKKLGLLYISWLYKRQQQVCSPIKEKQESRHSTVSLWAHIYLQLFFRGNYMYGQSEVILKELEISSLAHQRQLQNILGLLTHIHNVMGGGGGGCGE